MWCVVCKFSQFSQEPQNQETAAKEAWQWYLVWAEL